MRRELELTDLDWESMMCLHQGYALPIICPEDIFYAAPQDSRGLLFVQSNQLFSVLIESDDDDFPFTASWDIDAMEDPFFDAIMKQIEEMFTYESV